MSRRLLFIFAVLTVGVLAPAVAAADAGGRPFTTGLTGAAESAPATPTPSGAPRSA